jgi:hypothetical protein
MNDGNRNERNGRARQASPAKLVIVEQSGAKKEIPQPSAVKGMIEAANAMHSHDCPLREVKVVIKNRAVARWKAGEVAWRRVA